MDMPPPPSFWEMPAEIRRVACTRDEPCMSASRDDDQHHHEHDEERPAPSVEAMPPGQQLLDVPHMWRRQHEAWLHAVLVNQMINWQ